MATNVFKFLKGTADQIYSESMNDILCGHDFCLWVIKPYMNITRNHN